MFWHRRLFAAEIAFVRQYFGATLDAQLPLMRLHVRRLGDTRRALSMNGGQIYLPRSFYCAQDPRQPLRLDHPQIAGIFAHELLHQWQRRRGQAVSRQALWLHLKAFCLRRDPYAYCHCDDPEQMLQTFLCASVEQQGQIWEDHVRAAVAGRAKGCMAGVQAHVSGV